MAISITLAASRTSGSAPLGVVFDASATTSVGVTTRPFHDLYFVWDFGDSGSGNYGQGHGTLVSRNTAIGPVAAHLYETSGSYTVTLTVYDTAGNVAQTTQGITVNAFSNANTICVQNGGDSSFTTADSLFPGCSHVTTSSLSTVMTNLATDKRVLIFGGDVVTGNVALTSSKTNCLLGTYPVNSTKAIIRSTATTGDRIIGIGTCSDVRLVDLEFDGQSRTITAINNGSSSFGTLSMLRLNIHDIGGAIELSLNQISFPSGILTDGVFLHDSTMQTLTGGSSEGQHGILVGAENVSIQGCLFTGAVLPTEHLMRLQYLNKFVLSHNQLDTTADTKELVATRAPCAAADPCFDSDFSWLGLSGSTAHTRTGVVSRNRFHANTGVGVQISGVADTDSWVVKNVIYEQNFYRNDTGGTCRLVRIDGGGSTYGPNNITFRNELFYSAAGGAGEAMVDIGVSAVSDPTVINLFNCTLNSPSATFETAYRYNDAATGTISNCIAYSQNEAAPDVVSNGGSATEGTNSTDSQCANNRPWTANPPATIAEFQLASGVYAVTGGAEAIAVFDDYFGNIRNLSNMDIGFHALTTGSLPSGGGISEKILSLGGSRVRVRLT